MTVTLTFADTTANYSVTTVIDDDGDVSISAECDGRPTPELVFTTEEAAALVALADRLGVPLTMEDVEVARPEMAN